MSPILKFHELARLELKGNHLRTHFATFLLLLMLSISTATFILGIWFVDSLAVLVPAVGTGLFLLMVAIPITVSYEQMMLEFSRGRHDGLLTLAFDILGERFARSMSLPWIKWLIIGPRMLLLVVPGIMKSYDYSLAYYISYDNPQMSSIDCLRLSEKMMRGHRLTLFWLDMTFALHVILALATCCIGFIPLRPYYSCVHAKFYDWLKNNTEIEA